MCHMTQRVVGVNRTTAQVFTHEAYECYDLEKLFGRLAPNLVLSVQPVSLKSAFNWQMFKETG